MRLPLALLLWCFSQRAMLASLALSLSLCHTHLTVIPLRGRGFLNRICFIFCNCILKWLFFLFPFCSLMASAFSYVRQVSLQVCGSEQSSYLVHMNSFSHILSLSFLPNCSVFFTQGSLYTMVSSVSAQCSYRNTVLMFLAHFRVKC